MATSSYSSTTTTITVTISGLQQIQTYDREFEFDLRDSSSVVGSGSRVVSAGSSATSVSYTFTGLSPGTNYTYNVSAYNISVSPPYYLDGWHASARTRDPSPTYTFSASATAGRINCTWNVSQSESSPRKIITQVMVHDTTYIVASGTTYLPAGQGSVSFGFDLPNGTYDVTSRLYNSAETAILSTQSVNNLVVVNPVPTATFSASATGPTSVKLELKNIQSVSYNRTFSFKIFLNGTQIDNLSVSYSSGSSNDISVPFNNLTPDTTYSVTCTCSESGESYSGTVKTLKSGPWIFNGTEWKNATPYIYNGTAWKKATAFIYNGTAWKS